MNIPNTITILRIIAIPVFVCLLIYERLISALFIFIAAGVTDAIDGLIARFFRQQTTTGAYLDPIADKLMLASGYITLAAKGMIPTWLAVIVVGRDFVIAFGILFLQLTEHKVEIKPLVISKVTTFSQIFTVCWAILVPRSTFFAAFFPYPIAVTAALTCLSGLQYVYIGNTYLNEKGG